MREGRGGRTGPRAPLPCKSGACCRVGRRRMRRTRRAGGAGSRARREKEERERRRRVSTRPEARLAGCFGRATGTERSASTGSTPRPRLRALKAVRRRRRAAPSASLVPAAEACPLARLPPSLSPPPVPILLHWAGRRSERRLDPTSECWVRRATCRKLEGRGRGRGSHGGGGERGRGRAGGRGCTLGEWWRLSLRRQKKRRTSRGKERLGLVGDDDEATGQQQQQPHPLLPPPLSLEPVLHRHAVLILASPARCRGTRRRKTPTPQRTGATLLPRLIRLTLKPRPPTTATRPRRRPSSSPTRPSSPTPTAATTTPPTPATPRPRRLFNPLLPRLKPRPTITTTPTSTASSRLTRPHRRPSRPRPRLSSPSSARASCGPHPTSASTQTRSAASSRSSSRASPSTRSPSSPP